MPTLQAGFPVNAVAQNSASTTITKTITTTGAGPIVVALAGNGNNGDFPFTVTGAGLSWSKIKGETWLAGQGFPGAGTAEIWAAWASAALTSQTITATRASSANGSMAMDVRPYTAASCRDGSSSILNCFGAVGGNQQDASGTINASLTGVIATSDVIFALLDGSIATGLTANGISSFDASDNDAVIGCSISLGHISSNAGGSVTVGSTNSNTFLATAAAELLAASTALAGTAAGVAASSATLTESVSLAGAGAGASSSAATLTKKVALAGVSAGCTSATGNISAAVVAHLDLPLQAIDGFGASSAYSLQGSGYSSPVADFLWSQTAGIGASICRASITTNGWPQTFSPMDSTGIPTDGNFTAELQATSRGARLVATSWTAPAAWKTGGTVVNYPMPGDSDGGTLQVGHYQDYANQLRDFCARGLSAGVLVYAISPANEPDLAGSVGYGSMAWTPASLVTFVRDYLGPTLATWAVANSVAAPRVFLPESFGLGSTTLADYETAFDADSAALAYLGAYAWHSYAGIPSPASATKHAWQTEWFSQGTAYDDTIAYALTVANEIYSALTTGNVSAFLYWLAEDVSDNNNSALVGTNAANWTNPASSLADWNAPKFGKKAFAFGNFSRFVRPGSSRISVTGPVPSGVNLLGFIGPAGSPVIVAINTNGSAAALSWSFAGGGSPTAVVPWETASTALGAIGTAGNLGQLAAVTASSGVFTATLSANSITTFTAQPTPLAGVAAGSTAPLAVLTESVRIAGVAASVSASAGALTLSVALAGAAAGGSALAGILTEAVQLATRACGGSSSQASLGLAAALQGVAAGALALSGTLNLGNFLALAGVAAGASSSASALRLAVQLGGVAAGLTTAIGSTNQPVKLARGVVLRGQPTVFATLKGQTGFPVLPGQGDF